MPPSQAGIELREGLEEACSVVIANSDSCVDYRKMHLVVSQLKLETHFADVGELHGVAREVHEDLPNLVDVARHANWCGRNMRRECELFLMREWFDHRGHCVNQVGREEIRGANALSTFVEAGERQNFLDDRREVLCDRPHSLQHIELALGHR